MELFTQYYRTLNELMDVFSPEYRERFAENLNRRFELINRTVGNSFYNYYLVNFSS